MSLQTPSTMVLRRRDLKSDGWSADANKLFRLWTELLALSPSYELARRYRQQDGVLTDSDRARLPADFETVLKVYDDFGDVQNIFFKEWWQQRGLKLLGSKGDRPAATPLFRANAKQPLDDLKLGRTSKYFETAWEKAHKPEVLVVAIPMNIGRQKALKEVKRLIDKYAVALFEPPTPKYKLADKDMHVQSLTDAMTVLYMRAAKPKFRLWQVGVEAKISKTYSKLFDSASTQRNANNAEELRSLEMMTSRKYRQARFIAENAARGIFPSMKPPACMVDFDPVEFNRVISARLKWKKAEIKRLEAEGLTAKA